MNDYRSLTVDEIECLEGQGCAAEDWTRVNVAEEFDPKYVTNVEFHGDVYLGVFTKQLEVEDGFFRHSALRNATLSDVTIGDNCLIENIGCHICRYTIGEECHIANVGTMTTTDGATFGQAGTVAVMNEAGDGNVFTYDRLSAQMAAFMVEYAADKEVVARLKQMVRRRTTTCCPDRGEIGYRVKITNTREVVNTLVGDDCEICGASHLSDCTIVSTPDAGTFVGHDVVCDNTIIQAGASVTDGAKTDNCVVGEACHVGKGFSATNSVFFANSYMDNGEACAAFCGPFSVSHHKSTLLIGGQYSFYNAGSNTNFSNHAYKLGPVHYGQLERGAKTASGSHTLWPARIGAFSVCLGKIQNHPDTHLLPFSYVVGCADGRTLIVPGRNIATVGTYRDTQKWARRDLRPQSDRLSLVSFDWLNPCVMDAIVKGKQILDDLLCEQGGEQEYYTYNGCVIKSSHLRRGQSLYEMAISLAMGKAIEGHYCELPDSSVGTGQWTDLAGLPTPQTEADQLADDIRSGALQTIEQVEQRFEQLFANYETYKWNWAYTMLTNYLGIDSLTEAEMDDIEANNKQARQQWTDAIEQDAQREYDMGDVSDDTLNDFLKTLK